MVSLPFLLQRGAFTVKGTAHIIMLPVSKMLLEALRERENWSPQSLNVTEIERMTSHRVLLLFPWGGISWLKCYFLRPLTGLRARRRIQSARKINNIYFYNLFDRIQIGNRFVCCDNVCWVRGSQTVSPSGVLNVYEAIDSFFARPIQTWHFTLSSGAQRCVPMGLEKQHRHGIFLPAR